MTTTNHYDELLALTAEYQRAVNGRDKWQAKVDAVKARIDALMSPLADSASASASTPAPASTSTPAPTPASAPAEFANPAPVA